jgi:two-component sensor histidine kinase
MNSPTRKRARLMRLRNIERRQAEIRMARAAATLKGLEAISVRLDALRTELVPNVQVQPGVVIRAVADMQLRLEAAAHELKASLQTAQAAFDHEADRRNHATRREDGASRLHDIALAQDEFTAERRADALRIAPPRKRRTEQ